VKSEMVEGREAWRRFNSAMKNILAVSHSEIQKRIDEHRRQSANNPHRRGPKREVKPSASRGPAV
jgi:hypothetical protein